ncbi:MAG: hypothetical protein M3308_06095, partial [Actinomycetota bacterium]|nr:hypothetical protein [Actinomycetota bacterium]
MSPSNRRLVLGYGFAAAAAAMLGADVAASMRWHAAVPSLLPVPAETSWATAIYDAMLNPTEAVRRATASVADGPRDLQTLRMVVDEAMRLSLSSDYGALERSLPTLIAEAETATMQRQGDEPAAYHALSDVYAVAGWTLIKADNPLGGWITAHRAIQAAEQGDD